jgi:hypothetical protein
MRLFNVLTKKIITKDGQPLTLWHRVGLIKTTQSGNWYLQMFHQPDTDFYIVECKQEEAGELSDVQAAE